MPPQYEHNAFTPLSRSPSFPKYASLELLNPSHTSALRKTTFFNATFNLVATIVGGGVLSLPLAFARAGIVVATFLLILAAIITEFSLYILCSCARRTGSTSYMEIVRHSFGAFAETLTTVTLWLFLTGVLIAFNCLLMGIFTPIVADLFQIQNQGTGDDHDHAGLQAKVLLCILLLVSPLMLKRNLYALRHICYIGFTSVCVIALSMATRAFQKNFVLDDDVVVHDEVLRTEIKFVTDSWMDALFAFPICVLAFLCSFNVVEVHGALENPTRERIRSVIHTSITACFVLFLVFALAGYFYAYGDCDGNIFLNFDPSDPLILVGRMGMGVTLMFGTPVVLLPCREAFLTALKQLQELRYGSSSLVDDPHCATSPPHEQPHEQHTAHVDLEEHQTKNNCNETTPLSVAPNRNFNSVGTRNGDDGHVDDGSSAYSHPVDQSAELCPPEPTTRTEQIIHVAATVMISAGSYFGAVTVPGVAFVWSIIGSSIAMLIGFIIPAACYLKLRGHKGLWTRGLNLGALVLLIFSLVGAVACTAQTVWRLKTQGQG